MESINLELKASDSTANPYLALAGVILAGLDGVERGLVPPEPAPRDPVLLTPEQQAACGIRPLPASQAEALDALERDALLMEGLGDLMSRAYLATRRAENATCLARGDDWARLATFSTF